MEKDKLLHDLIVDRLRDKFSGGYKDIRINPAGSPDIVLGNHGLTLAVVEVETDKSITSEKAEEWTKMTQSGSKLVLMVPANSKVRVMELLWKSGIADRVGVGSYEIVIKMP
jgi:hypothetical protein